MSIASALTDLQADITAARTAITAKGGTVTSGGGSSRLATDIATIPSGIDIPTGYGLKEIRYYTLTVPEDGTAGIEFAGCQPNQAYITFGINSTDALYGTPSKTKIRAIAGSMTLKTGNYGRGGGAGFGITDSGTSAVVYANINGRTYGGVFTFRNTSTYDYSGTYKMYLYIYEKNYTGTVSVLPATSSIVIDPWENPTDSRITYSF